MSDLMDVERRRPAFAIRSTTFFGCATPLFCIFALLDYLEPISLSPAMLTAVSTVVVVLVMSKLTTNGRSDRLLVRV